MISQAGEGQPLSWGNLPADDGGALRKPSSRLACLQTTLLLGSHTRSALADGFHTLFPRVSSVSRSKASQGLTPRLTNGETEAQKGRRRAKATREGRAGAEFSPAGKEEAGAGRTTQRARSRALGLGGRAAGGPLPHRSCHGRTRGSSEPAFLNPVWKTRFISGRPAACQAL